MKNISKSKGGQGRSVSGGRRDKKLPHGFDSEAVKRYRKLDRDVRNYEEPTLEMLDLLGMALVTALHTVAEETDVRDRDSWDRYQEFINTEVIRTRKILGEEAARNFQILKARRD